MSRPKPTTRWAATLAGGAVVLVAVGGLLETLRRAVLGVEAAGDRVWTAGKLLAQQTQAAHLLDGTKSRTTAVLSALEDMRADGDPA